MDCAEIRDRFVAGRLPAGPEVEAHLRQCPTCPELFSQGAQLGRGLALSHAAAPPPDDLLALVSADLQRETGLRAALRALSSTVRASSLSVMVLALLGYQLTFNRREDFSQFSPLVFWAVVALLVAAVGLGALGLMRSVTKPLRIAARETWVVVALLALPALTVFVVPVGSPLDAADAYGEPLGCFVYGSVLVVPFVLLYWLFERRDRVPVRARVWAGALAGIAANLLLHAHCDSAHLGHLLLGHASIGAAWAVSLGLLARPFRAG